jgi:hypothetical protein
MKSNGIIVTGLAAVSTAFITASALGGAHTWRVVEAFSNADGTAQYIELSECCGGTGEIFVSGAPVTSNSHTFNFPANLSGNTANRHILLGTAAYAALPGAVAPDHIIPANFFNPSGDTLKYSVYDTWTFTEGVIATDCVHSTQHIGNIQTVNNPQNYASQVGSVSCPTPRCLGDANTNNVVDIDDLVIVITHWAQTGASVPGDVNHNNVVDIDDLVLVITHWGGC